MMMNSYMILICIEEQNDYGGIFAGTCTNQRYFLKSAEYDIGIYDIEHVGQHISAAQQNLM